MKTFLVVWFIGVVLVVVQGFLAASDGFFSQKQMRATYQSVTGWSFLEHGGMWADVFIVSPMVAFIVSRFDLPYWSGRGITFLVIALVITGVALMIYAMGGQAVPEAHTHDGKTTPAGWVHAIFAAGAIWIALMFYFVPINPTPESMDIIIVTGGLTVLFILGVRKFSPLWRFEKPVILQVVAEIALVWLAALRLIF